MRQRRVLLLDASCVIPGSHNARACRLFARAFEARGFTARYLIPRRSGTSFDGEEDAVERVLPYPYAWRYGIAEDRPKHGVDAALGALMRRHRPDLRSGLAERLTRPLADRRMTRLLAAALWPELARKQLGPADAILLPTADLYLTSAVLSWLAGRRPASAPALLLRFLGVLETEALYRPRAALKRLLRRAAALRRGGHRIVLAAEVEAWASELQERGGGELPILLLPTPPDAATAPSARPAPERLGLSLLSLRRIEQGAERLVPILTAIPSAERARLQIVGQLPGHPRANPEVEQPRLEALGVRLAPEGLSDAELKATLAALDLSLLPYLPTPYARRGSSMLFEAANEGHCVLASAGCGFSSEIERFGLGLLCVTDEDFAAALTALVRGGSPRDRAAAATQRYNAWRQAQTERALDNLDKR